MSNSPPSPILRSLKLVNVNEVSLRDPQDLKGDRDGDVERDAGEWEWEGEGDRDEDWDGVFESCRAHVAMSRSKERWDDSNVAYRSSVVGPGVYACDKTSLVV